MLPLWHHCNFFWSWLCLPSHDAWCHGFTSSNVWGVYCEYFGENGLNCIYSLSPSVVLWHHKTCLTMIQVLMAPSHPLKKNADILSIRLLQTYFNENSTQIVTISFKKMQLKMPSAEWRPFCSGVNVLNVAHKGSPTHPHHLCLVAGVTHMAELHRSPLT